MQCQFLFRKNEEGAYNTLIIFELLGKSFRKLSFFIAILFANTFTAVAQLPAFSFTCPSGGTPNWYVEIVPISTPSCGEVECYIKYFQVRLKTGDSFLGNPTSFLLRYEQFSLTIKTSTDPVGGLSAVNQALTEACFPYAFQSNYPLGFDSGNEITFLTTGDCSISTTPNIVFTRAGSGPPYIADLFVIAVEGIPGEVVQFELTQSLYTCPDVPVSCSDALFLDADTFTFSSPSGSEPNVCVAFGDYDTDTHLIPVKVTNSSNAQIDVDYLSFTIEMAADNIMQTPILTGFLYTPVEQSVIPIPGTDDWRIFVRFDASAGISAPALAEDELFSIEIIGPVNQSLEANVELCLTQGQIRRTGSGTCRNACLDACAEINFDGFAPCDPNNFTVVVEAEEAGANCEELEVKVVLNWSSYSSALDFDQIRIAVEFDLPSGVTIDHIGANTFGCPANPTCAPESDFDNCFKIDGNQVIFCFFPNTPEEVTLGDYFTVVFNAPSNCINGATVRESVVDVSTSPPGGTECVPNVVVENADFPLCTPQFKGWVKNTDGDYVDDVDIKVSRVPVDTGCPNVWIWPNNSDWSHCPCDAAQYRVIPKVRNNDAWWNGVTTYDIAMIYRHLNGIVPFTAIYQYAAADANGNNQIEFTGGAYPDILSIKQLILGITDTLANQTSWRYFDENSPGTLPTPTINDPFMLPSEFRQVSPSNTDLNFIAVKVGDLNNSHNNDLELRPAGMLPLRTELKTRPAAGEYLSLPIRYEGAIALTALQMGLRFDADSWEYAGISKGDAAQVSEASFNLLELGNGEMKFIWYGTFPDDYVRPGQTLFFLTLRAKKAIRDASRPIRVDDALLRSIAYTPEGIMYNLGMEAATGLRDAEDNAVPSNLEVNCAPNPASGAVSLQIKSSQDARTAMVWAYSAFGTRLLRREIPLTGNSTVFQIPDSDQWPAGVYIWKVKVGDEKTEGRLVKQ